MIAVNDGHRSVAGCRTSDVRKLRDRMQDKPGKANNWMNVFRTIMAYAAENDWRRDNPAAGIKPLPIGEREPWPADVLTRAMAAASPMLRLALVSGLCSGARIGDVIRMQHGWHDGSIMEMRASKNKTDVAIPMHPLWLEALAGIERKSVTILYDRGGKPFASTKTLQERVRTLMKSIAAPEFTFHGLRKNAACYLVEMGLSDAEVGAIVAMTPETVRHYSKRARTLMMARGVADKVTKGDVVPLKGGRALGGAK